MHNLKVAVAIASPAQATCPCLRGGNCQIDLMLRQNLVTILDII